MSKYKPLSEYLSNLQGESFTTNFTALEAILGFQLPESARQYPAWWANQDRGQSAAWQSAGWKSADVSIELGTLTFVRVGSQTQSIWDDLGRHLTIAQAKAGLAKSLGVSPDSIEITIRA